MPRTTSFSGTPLKEFSATPLRARNHGKKPSGKLLLMWSVPNWVMDSSLQIMLQYEPDPTFHPASAGWLPFISVTSELTFGLLADSIGILTTNPYNYVQTFGGIPPVNRIKSYKWDTDPYPMRIFAYYCSTLTGNFCTQIPWSSTPWSWASAFGLGQPGIFLSSLTPYDGDISVVANLAQQFLAHTDATFFRDPSAKVLVMGETQPEIDLTQVRTYTIPKLSIPWNIQRQGIEVPPSNKFRVPVVKFLMDDGITEAYGWQGVITNDSLDDDAYLDPYFTCPFSPDIAPEDRDTEFVKPVMQPLAFKMSLMNTGEDEEERLSGFVVRGLVNEIYVYTYYRIVRESASNIAAYCSDSSYDVSPIFLYPYCNPYYGDGNIVFPWSGPNPPAGFTAVNIVYSLNSSGNAGEFPYFGSAGLRASCGVGRSSFPVDVFFYDGSKATFKSASSVFYNETIGSFLFNPINPPNFSGVDTNPGEQPTCRNVTFSTHVRDRIEYRIDGCSLGMYGQDLSFYWPQPAPVDSLEVLLETDKAPFFNSMSDWDLTGCHRRLIHTWALTKTPQELLDDSHTVLGLTDQLSDLAALSQTDRSAALGMLAANASGSTYGGDVPDADNVGYWFASPPLFGGSLNSPIPLINWYCVNRSTPSTPP